MRIVEINTVDYGSTGRIMLQIANSAREHGHQVWTFSMGRKEKTRPVEGHQYYLSYFSYCMHYVLGRITGCNGMLSLFATIRLIGKICRIHPDIIHLHNLHGFSINIPLLFSFLKCKKHRVVWTLHDCWAYTGHCAHYASVRCDKWKTGCYSCPIYKNYPESCYDNSGWMWKRKRKWFSGLHCTTLVTPSKWLASQVKASFLRDYQVRVINNGINLAVFQPVESAFRARYGCEHRKIVLGVAFDWGGKKGLDVFIALSARLPENYQIVLVGGNEQMDRHLPANVISIHRTQDQRELAEIYSAADVFVNPTREDNFPTVNLEALACGTPVVTFDTGGSPECIDETCGIVVPCDDVDALHKAIVHVAEDHPFSQDACVKRAQGFDQTERFAEYVALYRELARHA